MYEFDPIGLAARISRSAMGLTQDHAATVGLVAS
jgi:hypothetical protein